jgi:hypothetical protein
MSPQRITLGEMRQMGVRGALIYCADYHCSHSVALSADRWPDEARPSDIEPRFVCAATAASAGQRFGRAFNWNRSTVPAMRYRNAT